jgi:protein SCO1/2
MSRRGKGGRIARDAEKGEFLMRRLLLLLSSVGLLLGSCAPEPSYNGAVIDPPVEMADFTLDADSGPVSLSDLQGKYVALFFGYTHCQDVCPTTMADLNYAVGDLDDAAGDIQVLFVSVDWKRDTPESASEYAHVFNPAFVGLGGSKDEIDSVTSEYGIYYLFGPPDPEGNYEVEHTTSVLVLDPAGNLVLTWPQGTTAEQIKQDMQTLVGG